MPLTHCVKHETEENRNLVLVPQIIQFRISKNNFYQVAFLGDVSREQHTIFMTMGIDYLISSKQCQYIFLRNLYFSPRGSTNSITKK